MIRRKLFSLSTSVSFSLVVALSSFAFATHADDILLLTGKIGSANKQVVTAPKTERWQIQVQWLAEEGKVVNVGDPVVTFDGSSMQSQLDVSEEQAETLKLELKQLEME